MPLKRCTEGKMHGWKWGDQGKCYQSKKDAIKQGVAIEGPEKFHQMAKEFHGEELILAGQALNDAEKNAVKEASFAEIVEKAFYEMDETVAYVSKKERDKMPSGEFGDPENKKFPVKDRKHWDAAIRLIGRAPAKDREKIKKNLKRIGEKHGYPIPDDWK